MKNIRATRYIFNEKVKLAMVIFLMPILTADQFLTITVAIAVAFISLTTLYLAVRQFRMARAIIVIRSMSSISGVDLLLELQNVGARVALDICVIVGTEERFKDALTASDRFSVRFQKQDMPKELKWSFRDVDGYLRETSRAVCWSSSAPELAQRPQSSRAARLFSMIGWKSVD